MTMTSIEVETKIQELLEGVLPEEQWPALRQELMNSREARAYYCKHVKIHTLLRLRSERIQFLKLRDPVVPVDEIIRNSRYRSLKYAGISAAAIFIAIIITMWMVFVPENPPGLTFRESPGTRYTVEHSGGTDASAAKILTQGSRLTVSQGVVELTFSSGVKSIVVAPADLTLHENDVLFMNRGNAWFHVPKGAEGFTVKTSDLDIVDLGTEFGVIVKPDEHDEVHVFKGEVEVSANRIRMESRNLAAGEARRIDPVGRLVAIPVRKPSSFMTSLPKTLPHLHWSFDDKDGIQVKGNYPGVDAIKSKAVNGAEFVPGRKGNALSLNGNGQYLITDWYGLGGSRSRTISFWVRLPEEGIGPGGCALVAWGDNYTKGGKWEVAVAGTNHSSQAHLSLGFGQKTIPLPAPIRLGKWEHIAVTYSGMSGSRGHNLPECYINGNVVKLNAVARQVSAAIHTKTGLSSSQPLTIGAFIGLNGLPIHRRYLKAQIDELYVFDGYMTRDQIEQLARQ